MRPVQKEILVAKVKDLHKEWSRDRGYMTAYETLGPEFELDRALIEARTQAELSRRLHPARRKLD